jgi:lipopolysaccharide transport system ATP-binding protein
VRRGEVVGVIGRNGAGKSTLLKLLSRITEPTEGRARIRGRVRSLLEVGTGFHPELTGRDNVYLNGALLGMRRAEIRRKFDEIIAFADVERFLDTPVKRYSSGMAVRLGFAVAAHLEPEILLVDEVLAVGDLGFQRKCLGKMKDVAGDGRTVLFVSHGMAAVRQLCPRVILIDGGRIVCDGAAEESIEAYRALFRERRDIPPAERTDREGTGRMRIVEAVVRDAETGHVGVVAAGHTAEFRFVVRRPALQDPNLLASLAFRMSLFDAQSQCLAHCCNAISGERLEAGGGEFAVSCVVPRLPLNRGAYTLSASVGDAHETYDYLLDVAAFDVTPGPFYTTGRLPEADHSSLLMDYRWSTQESP